jgi:hypothetical protein
MFARPLKLETAPRRATAWIYLPQADCPFLVGKKYSELATGNRRLIGAAATNTFVTCLKNTLTAKIRGAGRGGDVVWAVGDDASQPRDILCRRGTRQQMTEYKACTSEAAAGSPRKSHTQAELISPATSQILARRSPNPNSYRTIARARAAANGLNL